MNTRAEAHHLSNAIVEDIMPTSAPSMEPVPSEPEDPWDWSVEQVIDAVCYHKDSLMAGIDTSELVLTNPPVFEQQLRENSVRGLTFLKDVDRASLREDLHMQNLGDRSSVLHLIQILRRKSPKYINHLHLISSSNHNAAARSFLQQSPIAPGSRIYSWVQEPHFPSKASSPGQSLLDERPLAVPIGVPKLDSPKPVKSSIPTPPLHEPVPADQGHIPDSSNAFGEEKDEDVAPRILDSNALEHMRGGPAEKGLDLGDIGARAGETFVVDETGRKRRRLVLGSAEPLSTRNLAENLQNGVEDANSAENPQNGIEDAILAENLPNSVENAECISVANGQQLVGLSSLEVTPTTTDEHDMSLPPVIEHFDNAKPTINSPEAIPLASTCLDQKSNIGVVFIDDKGRKRIKPFLKSPIEPARSESVDTPEYSSNVQQNTSTFPGSDRIPNALKKDRNLTTVGRIGQARSATNAYLGPSALPVDRIFYGDIPLNHEIEYDFQVDELASTEGTINHTENFTILSKNRFGSGQRTYVNGQLQRFLRSAIPERFRNNDREVTGIVPYSESLARKHQPLSMTTYLKSSGAYIATRSNRSEWHNVDEEWDANKVDESTIFNFPEIFVQQNDDPLDPDRLEKWKYLKGDDKVLPAYGDSGSEGEYDLDTWREMEREQGKRGRLSGKLPRHSNLDNAQVNAIIDRALEQFAEDWQVKMAPKVQRLGWKFWHKCRKQGNREARVNELTATVNHLENRSRNLRKEILEEIWSSEKQVLKQTKSMQETMFDQKHAEWQLSIVKLRRAPEKPAPLHPKLDSKNIEAACQPVKDGEKRSDSDGNASYDSDEEMDDFIVSDDDNVETGLSDEWMVAEAGTAERSQSPVTPKSNDHTPMNGTPNAADDAGSLKKSSLFKSKRKSPPVSKFESAYIDLTQLSDPVEPEASEFLAEPESKLPCRIRTPPLDAVNDTDSSFRRYRKKPVKFRKPLMDSEIINLESDIEESGKAPAIKVELPAFNDVSRISQMDAQWLEERQDRKRLLIWAIARCPKELRESAITEVGRVSYQTMETNVWKSLASLPNETLKNGRIKMSELDAYMRIVSWFITWTIPVRINRKAGIQRAHLAAATDDVAGFKPFYSFLKTCLAHYIHPEKVESLSQNSAKETPVKRVLLEDSADRSQGTPVKKRKYEVQQSQEAIDLQYRAQERVRQQELRKDELKHRFKAFRVNDEDPAKVIVNLSKEDHHDFIFINPKIGRRIQEHQKDGVRFMWRELTADHNKLQGCLLSHTMGLGKTMQVITLLVTIAEAAKSTNDKVSSQVPPALRKSQTLVLCPPSLLDNWYEEFLMWAPDPFAENVGAIRNVTSAMKLEERIDEIDRWRDDGGVLLLGYQTFRSMVNNPFKSSGQPSSNDDSKEADHQRMAKTLLETPNIVVADEAHQFKGLNSHINKAMTKIKTTSRIALTGSPLSNNLNEYYAVIEWIAPKYLGDHIHFKAHYIEPVEEGLYKESTDAQYRTSRKILKALQLSLEPKVHRADNSVLKERLHGKVEFLIRVPLTDLQRQVYEDYVSYMQGTHGYKNASQTTMFAWLQDLRVLCNHPKIFEDKLRHRLQAARSKSEIVGDGTPPKLTVGKKNKAARAEPDGMDEEELDPELPTTVTGKLLAVYKAHATPLDPNSLSFKMLILKKILDLAKKAGDKALVFSHSLSTLDYVENLLRTAKKSCIRIDGATQPNLRQQMTRQFNQTNKASICLIATKAGGLGLNMYGANRVIILDSNFNPMHEEQAIGRAYRIGQQKPVFVYRLTIGGTFEECLVNQGIFKHQLATRVVDQKDIKRSAGKSLKQYLFPPKPLTQEDLTEYIGKDRLGLDQLLIKNEGNIRSITLTESFQEEDTVKLSEEDLQEAHQLREDLDLRNRDPAAYYAMLTKRNQVANAQFQARQSQFANVSLGQAPVNATPTPLGNAILPNHDKYENWRLACQAGVNAIPTKLYAGHSSMAGAPEFPQMIGSSSVQPTQNQSSTTLSNTISSLHPTSTAGRAAPDVRPVGGPPNVSKGEMPNHTTIHPNPPQVLTDKIGSANAQTGEQNTASDEPRANMMDLNTGSNSTVISVPENAAKKQNAATPNGTVTSTSDKSQKPTMPPKTTLGVVAQSIPGTRSRSSSNGPVASKQATTALVTADARRVLRSDSRASSLSAGESKQKRSSTPSARACGTSFTSGFDSLNDAFKSGSGLHHTAKS